MQWFKHGDHPKVLEMHNELTWLFDDPCEEDKGHCDKPCYDHGCFWCEATGNWKLVCPTDWILKYEDGHHEKRTDAQFKLEFEKIDSINIPATTDHIPDVGKKVGRGELIAHLEDGMVHMRKLLDRVARLEKEKIMFKSFKNRRRYSFVYRFFAPSYGSCYRCKMPWNVVEGHATPYREGNACFPLCEQCWRELTPEERIPYYSMLFYEWGHRPGCPAVLWNQIRAAVLDGK